MGILRRRESVRSRSRAPEGQGCHEWRKQGAFINSNGEPLIKQHVGAGPRAVSIVIGAAVDHGEELLVSQAHVVVVEFQPKFMRSDQGYIMSIGDALTQMHDDSAEAVQRALPHHFFFLAFFMSHLLAGHLLAGFLAFRPLIRNPDIEWKRDSVVQFLILSEALAVFEAFEMDN